MVFWLHLFVRIEKVNFKVWCIFDFVTCKSVFISSGTGHNCLTEWRDGGNFMGCEDFFRTLRSCMIFLWSAVTCASIFLTSKEESTCSIFFPWHPPFGIYFSVDFAVQEFIWKLSNIYPARPPSKTNDPSLSPFRLILGNC